MTNLSFNLKASGYLHDVGFPPDPKHNVNGFKWLKERFDRRDAQGILSETGQSIVLYCILWHRGDDFEERAEVKLEQDALQRARHLASILRIADGLCYPHGRPTQKASVSKEGGTLLIEACPSRKDCSLSTQVAKANEKKNLLVQVLTTVPEGDITEVEIRRCSHADCSRGEV